MGGEGNDRGMTGSKGEQRGNDRKRGGMTGNNGEQRGVR